MPESTNPGGTTPIPSWARPWYGTVPEGLSWHLPPDQHEPGSGYINLGTAPTEGGRYPLVSTFIPAWKLLVEWATSNGLYLHRYSNVTYTDDVQLLNLQLPLVVYVSDLPTVNQHNTFPTEPGACWNCDLPLSIGDPICRGCNLAQICDQCGLWSSGLVLDDPEGEGRLVCHSCSYPCTTCGVRSAHTVCAAHAVGERHNCINCGRYTDDSTGCHYSEYWDGWACGACASEIEFCSECDTETRYITEGLCEDCYERQFQSRLASVSQEGTEEYEESEKLEREMFVEAIAGRENIRLTGLEIEGGGNYRSLGAKLHDAGLTNSASMMDYHSATRNGVTDFWQIERDGSVDWELVSPPINLADQTHVRGLRTALRLVREEIKLGTVSLDMRCGLHIHVGAERTAIGGAYNLGTIWNYLEDVVFRLGAAKWPKHRAIVNGVHYCRPTVKGAKSRLEFGLQMDRQEDARYNALSFNNYIRAMSRGCTCGAVRYDSWDQCVCNLGKCTFEFRVFNGSANMHKIHAYLALCQALVAHATSLPDLDADLFPAQEFVPRMVDELGGTVRELHTEAWKPRLEFLFNELPLTDPEKADLLYCVRSSELQVLGDEFINSLAPTNAQEVLV